MLLQEQILRDVQKYGRFLARRNEYPIVVSIKYESSTVSDTAMERYEVLGWLFDNGYYYESDFVYWGGTFRFKDEKKAIHFKLRWA